LVGPRSAPRLAGAVVGGLREGGPAKVVRFQTARIRQVCLHHGDVVGTAQLLNQGRRHDEVTAGHVDEAELAIGAV
jgi:hypothetical protein